MRNAKCSLAGAIFCLLFSHNASATVLNVPSPEYPTIQAGLNAAAAGDTVLVAPGIYNVDIISWPDQNGITLLGSGMDSTIVIGDAWQATFYVAPEVPIDTTTVIQGLTIRNGEDAGVILLGCSALIESCRVDSSSAGPGIWAVYDVGAIVRHSVIEGNAGPGLRLENCDSTLMIVENQIIGNTAQAGAAVKGAEPQSTRRIYPGGFVVSAPVTNGGGIYCDHSSPTITGNTISGNSANNDGGGIYCYYSSPSITANTICANSASSRGGGISCFSSHPTITANAISANSANSFGGGISCSSSHPTITANAISANSANQYGGGISCYDNSDPTITGNTISGNSANYYGGGISCSRVSCPAITANIISTNSANQYGGGISCDDYSSPVITANTIVRNKTLGDGGGVYVLVLDFNPTLRQNTITENTADGLGDGFYTDQTTMSVDSCNIAYNGWGLHNADPVNIPLAYNNWWGHHDGPWHQSQNPGGLGDSLNAYAKKFKPYLSEADTMAPPIPPIGLQAFEVGDTYISISWLSSPIGDLAGYRVFFDSDSSGFPYADSVDAVLDTAYTLSDLTPLTTYYIAVTCYDHLGERSWYSKEIEVTTVADFQPPIAVDDLACGLISAPKRSVGDIYLWWTEPDDNIGVARYVIYRATSPDAAGDSLAGTTELLYTDIGAAGDTLVNHYYTVTAVDAAENKSEHSNKVGEFDRYLIPETPTK